MPPRIQQYILLHIGSIIYLAYDYMNELTNINLYDLNIEDGWIRFYFKNNIYFIHELMIIAYR